MSIAVTVAIGLIVIAATTILTLSVIGLVRIPETYVKVHAAAKAVALCPLLVLVAVLPGGDIGFILRAVIVGALMLLTAPVAAHAIVRLRMRQETEKAEEPEP
jgi:multicomponent Na+:H+ antiporter subunit G